VFEEVLNKRNKTNIWSIFTRMLLACVHVWHTNTEFSTIVNVY